MPSKFNKDYNSNNSFLKRLLRKDIYLFVVVIYLLLIPVALILSKRFSIENELLISITCFSVTILLLFYWFTQRKERHEFPDEYFDDVRERISKEVDKLNYRIKNLHEVSYKMEKELHYPIERYEDLKNELIRQNEKQNNQFHELQNTFQNLERKLYRDYEKVDDRIGVHTIYLDYKSLQVSDLSKLLASYYNLYKLFYKVNFNNDIQDIEAYFKNHPEDILEILSAHTGNSITIKIKTGWTPSVGLKDGDFEVAIPKGYVTLIFVGYILHKLFSFGVTNYKDILEIENKKLENEKLQYELQELKEKCKNQDKETDKEIQAEILNFYFLTAINSNITRVEVNQSSNIQK